MNIRDLIKEWSSHTYKYYIDKAKLDGKNVSLILSILEDLKLLDKPCDGTSYNTLPPKENKPYNGNDVKVSFSEAFKELLENDDLNIVNYLITVFENRTSEDLKIDEKGLLLRALKTFIALVREPDLEYQLRNACPTYYNLYSNTVEDLENHTDIVIECEILIRLWLYTASNRGLSSFSDKIKGKRGDLAKGINVTIPLDTDFLQEKESVIKSIKSKEKLILSKQNKISELESKKGTKGLTVKQEADLVGLKKSLKETIDFLDRKNQKLADLNAYEENILVESISGFYLYNSKYVEKIVKFLKDIENKEIVPLDYNFVKYNICSLYGNLFCFEIK